MNSHITSLVQMGSNQSSNSNSSVIDQPFDYQACRKILSTHDFPGALFQNAIYTFDTSKECLQKVSTWTDLDAIRNVVRLMQYKVKYPMDNTIGSMIHHLQNDAKNCKPAVLQAAKQLQKQYIQTAQDILSIAEPLYKQMDQAQLDKQIDTLTTCPFFAQDLVQPIVFDYRSTKLLAGHLDDLTTDIKTQIYSIWSVKKDAKPLTNPLINLINQQQNAQIVDALKVCTDWNNKYAVWISNILFATKPAEQ